jgi:hypothetical protein
MQFPPSSPARVPHFSRVFCARSGDFGIAPTAYSTIPPQPRHQPSRNRGSGASAPRKPLENPKGFSPDRPHVAGVRNHTPAPRKNATSVRKRSRRYKGSRRDPRKYSGISSRVALRKQPDSNQEGKQSSPEPTKPLASPQYYRSSQRSDRNAPETPCKTTIPSHPVTILIPPLIPRKRLRVPHFWPILPEVGIFLRASRALCARRGILSRILPKLPIHCHAHILVRSKVAKLHHPMPLPRQLTPRARLFRILLDRLVLPPAQNKPHRPKPPRPSPHHPPCPPLHHNLGSTHKLLRNGNQNRVFQHDHPHPTNSLSS